jgi:hypothetical protein
MRKVLLLVLLLLPAASLLGAEVQGLYESDVRVFSQDGNERVEAMKTALSEVLVRVSGREAVLHAIAVQKALANPASLLRLYGYRAQTTAEKEAYLEELKLNPPAEDKGRTEPQMVSFSYDKAAVDKLLLDSGYPVWGTTRPAVLVWLALQDEQGRYLLGADAAAHPVNKLLYQEARARGLAVVQPLLDATDLEAVSVADVWGALAEPLHKAAARYRAEAVLVGRIAPGPANTWQAQWSLLEGAAGKTWQADADSRRGVIRAGVNGVTEALAAQYVPFSRVVQSGTLSLLVLGAKSLADYARVSAYLQSLQSVTQVHLARVEPDRLHYELRIEGNAAGVARTIALGNVLRAGPVEGGAAPDDREQVYQLLP